MVLASLPYSLVIPSSGVIASSQITAASGSAADIQAAVNGVIAAGGGTVYIPAGDWSCDQASGGAVKINLQSLPAGAWLNILGSNNIVTTTQQNGVPITCPATILRSTSDSATDIIGTISVVGSPLAGNNFNNYKSENRHIRIAYLTILGKVTNDLHSNYGISMGFADGFLIDHCFIDSNSQTDIGTSYSKGVISNCSLTQYYHQVIGGVWGYGVMVTGNSGYWNNNLGTPTWITNVDDIVGKYDWDGIPINYSNPQVYSYTETYGGNHPDTQGTTSHISYTAGPIYIESNFFNFTRHPVASSQYGYYVARYNTVPYNVPNLQAFDIHGRGFPAGRYGEFYGNAITGTAYAVDFRGAGGIVFNNTFINNVHDVALGNEAWNATGVYDPQYISNTYIWGNTHIGSGDQIYAFANQNITLGVNYFTTAKPNYTPYVYPHPYTP